MGQQIIKQPDGRFAVFSSVVDNFVIVDATPQEIIDVWVADEGERLKRRVLDIIEQLENGGTPYFQFTMTYEDALETIRRAHGNASEKGMLDEHDR